MSICLVIRVCPLLYFGGRVKYADNFYYGPCPKLKFVYIVVCLFFLMFYCLCFYSYPYFSPSPPTTHPTSNGHCQSPHCWPCPGVLHIRFLTNPYTLFQPVRTSPVPLPAVSLFHDSIHLVLFCSLVYFVHDILLTSDIMWYLVFTD